MKKLLFALCGLVAMLATACDKPGTPEVTLTIDGETTIEVAADATSATVAFHASEAWTASVEAITKAAPEWLTLAPESGEAGANTLTLTLTANTAETPRSATIRIVCASETATVTLTQHGTEDNNGEPEPDPEAVILKQLAYDSDFLSSLIFTTDAEGRITGFDYTDDGDIYRTTEFSYKENQVIWINFDFPEQGMIDTVKIYELTDGRITKSYDPERSTEENYTYNPDGTLALFTSDIKHADGTVAHDRAEYTWTDGNLTRIKQTNSFGDVTLVTFEYGTETFNIANYDVTFQFLPQALIPEMYAFRLLGTPCRTLPTSHTEQLESNTPITFTHTYEFGADKTLNKITVATTEDSYSAYLKY